MSGAIGKELGGVWEARSGSTVADVIYDKDTKYYKI